MKIIILLASLCCVALCDDAWPDFSHYIAGSERPEFQATLKRFFPGLVKRSHESRIIGGSPAAAGQFPHQAFLVFDASWMCGGALISPSIVLVKKNYN